MPWVKHEPVDVEKRISLLRSFRARFDLDEDYVYGIFDRHEKIVVGGTGLHPRVGAGGLEIGYWIHVDHVGQGLATETAGALTRVAFVVHDVRRMEIHCDPANAASAAVAKKLGYTHEATLRQRMLTPESAPRDTMIWTMTREELAASPAANIELEAVDAAGRRLI